MNESLPPQLLLSYVKPSGGLVGFVFGARAEAIICHEAVSARLRFVRGCSFDCEIGGIPHPNRIG